MKLFTKKKNLLLLLALILSLSFIRSEQFADADIESKDLDVKL